MSLKRITCVKCEISSKDRQATRRFFDAFTALSNNFKKISVYRDSKACIEPSIFFVFFMPDPWPRLTEISKKICLYNSYLELEYNESVNQIYREIIEKIYSNEAFMIYKSEIVKLYDMPANTSKSFGEIIFSSKIFSTEFSYSGKDELISVKSEHQKKSFIIKLNIGVQDALEFKSRIKRPKLFLGGIYFQMFYKSYIFDLYLDFQKMCVEAKFTDCHPKFSSDFLDVKFINEIGISVAVTPVIILIDSTLIES